MKRWPVALVLLGLAACPVYGNLGEWEQFAAGTSSGVGSSSASSTGGASCMPGATAPCYDGPAGTAGVGMCKAGTKTCGADGTTWGACVGEVLPQPPDCASGMDVHCDGMAPACTGDLLWAKRFGDLYDQRAQSVSVDGVGNVIIAGRFSGTIDFGGGPLGSADGSNTDVFVVKLDPNGNYLWADRFTSAISASVAVDGAGNVVVAGSFLGSMNLGGATLKSAGGYDIFIAKLDPSGNAMWSERFGDPADQIADGVAVDGSGDLLVTGSFAGSPDIGGTSLVSAGGYDVLVMKLDANGVPKWSRGYGDAAYQEGKGIAADASGNVFVTGSFAGALDFGQGPLVSAGGNDVFVAKLDPNGNAVWGKRFGDATEQIAWGVATTNAGAAVITGYFFGAVNFGNGPLVSAGKNDIFVAELDASGNAAWSERFGGADTDSGRSVAVDSVGNVLVTGFCHASADLGGGMVTDGSQGHIFLVKLDPNGGHLWSKGFGDGVDQGGASIITDGSDDVLVAGYMTGTVDFGSASLTSAGAADVFVAKFAP